MSAGRFLARGCEGKNRYPDRDLAETVRARRQPLERRRLNSYLCPVCGSWHLGGRGGKGARGASRVGW